MDYHALGLKVGLEIHQQLDTHKLFCQCTSELTDHEAVEFVRLLRPTQSEMGEVDGAAQAEARKHLRFRYQAPATTCLVEADDEPPHEVNPEAVEATLLFAALVNAQFVDEIHFMRKVVIDGSNTAGFQRTALVALNGSMGMGNMAPDGLESIGISTISLEEDAARKVAENEKEATYRLDRLGIPLIEVATEPEIRTPKQAKNVALRIGALLRATKQVKRGIGTIREDLNISIVEGARVEIKGVQEPKLISVYVEEEMIRQLLLVEVRKALEVRGIDREEFTYSKDLSEIFRDTKSKVLSKWLEQNGVVYGIKLKGFQGLFGTYLTAKIGVLPQNEYTNKERRAMGPEFADYLKPLGIKGLFHSDEVPGYGISEEEVLKVREFLKMDEGDGFVLVAEMKDKARDALDIIIKRAKQAFLGVPEETRDPLPDGTTQYSRPLPGGARMYPETDVPPISITPEKIATIKSKLPTLPEDKEKHFIESFGLSLELANQLIAAEYDELFETLLEGRINQKNVLAKILLNTLPELKSEGVDISKIDEGMLNEVLSRLGNGEFAKEGIPDILKHAVNNYVPVERAIAELGLGTLSQEDMEGIIDSVIKERMELVQMRGMEALGTLMGDAMKKLKGRADGKKVNEVLKKRLKEAIR